MATFAVTTAKGPGWDRTRGTREQAGWVEHAAYFDALVERGVVVLGGPIGSDDDEEVGLLLVEAANEGEVRAAFAADPWAKGGVLRIGSLRPWRLWLDGRRRPSH